MYREYQRLSRRKSREAIFLQEKVLFHPAFTHFILDSLDCETWFTECSDPGSIKLQVAFNHTRLNAETEENAAEEHQANPEEEHAHKHGGPRLPPAARGRARLRGRHAGQRGLLRLRDPDSYEWGAGNTLVLQLSDFGRVEPLLAEEEEEDQAGQCQLQGAHDAPAPATALGLCTGRGGVSEWGRSLVFLFPSQGRVCVGGRKRFRDRKWKRSRSETEKQNWLCRCDLGEAQD